MTCQLLQSGFVVLVVVARPFCALYFRVANVRYAIPNGKQETLINYSTQRSHKTQTNRPEQNMANTKYFH